MCFAVRYDDSLSLLKISGAVSDRMHSHLIHVQGGPLHAPLTYLGIKKIENIII